MSASLVEMSNGSNLESLLLTATSIAIGAVLTHFYYARSKIFGQLAWAYVGQRMLNEDAKFLEVRYKNKKISRPFKLQIQVWNNGRTTISGTDIAQNHGLNFENDSLRFLDSWISKQSNPAAEARSLMASNGQVVNIAFSYLDPGDGFELEIICDAIEGSDDGLHVHDSKNLILSGAVRGLTRGIVFAGNSYNVPIGYSDSVVMGGISTFTFGLLAFLIYSFVDFHSTKSFNFGSVALALILGGMLLLLVVGPGLIAWQNWPRYNMPDSIRPFQ